VAFVTGHVRDGAEPGAGPDWQALARSGLTLVVYMGLSTAAGLVEELLAGGLAADTPAAAIAAAHTERQRQAITTLGGLVETLAREQIRSPAILVIGEVVREALPGLVLEANLRSQDLGHVHGPGQRAGRA
jgi:uroporphyrin-III C-methyltransferase